MSNKAMELLQSRKFWASLIGLLATLGIGLVSDVEATKLIDAIMIIVGIFVGGTALEDGLTKRS